MLDLFSEFFHVFLYLLILLFVLVHEPIQSEILLNPYFVLVLKVLVLCELQTIKLQAKNLGRYLKVLMLVCNFWLCIFVFFIIINNTFDLSFPS